METITNEIITKLRCSAVDEFIPLGKALRAGGFKDNDILRTFDNYRNAKTRQFYDKAKHLRDTDFISIAERLEGKTADSRAEIVMLKMLTDANISFKFQYKIGPYRVDFLIDGFIVLECDGPQHAEQREYDEKRDKYIEKLGYNVVRVNWNIITLIPDVFIEEMKALIVELKS